MVATPTTSIGFQNFYSSTLSADITALSTDIFINTVPAVSESFLVIDPDNTTGREVIYYNSKTATKVTCPSVADGRGQGGTTAGAHLTGTTVIMAPLADFFSAILGFSNTNTTSLQTLYSNNFFDHVISGCVLSGTGYGSTLAWSLTSGSVYINGKVLTVSAATGTVTASKDTYFDVLDPGSGTVATLVNTAGNIVANNAASPALAANSVRIGIVVSGATSIAAASSINQGQEDRVLPIASSIPYTVTDSLGNLINPRDPNRRTIGYRQITSSFSTTTTATDVDVTGLSTTVIVPAGRSILITTGAWAMRSSQAAGNDEFLSIKEGATVVGQMANHTPAPNYRHAAIVTAKFTPSSGTHTYKVAIQQATAGTMYYEAAAAAAAYIRVELV